MDTVLDTTAEDTPVATRARCQESVRGGELRSGVVAVEDLADAGIATGPDPVAPGRSDRVDASRRSRAPLVLGLLLWLAVVGPLVVGLATFTSPRWYPTDDLAQTELRVRDVGTVDTPLLGPIARIGGFADRGSHPGPLVFYSLAPVYRLGGSSSTSLATSALVLHAVAVGLVLWLANRRAGLVVMAGIGVGLAVLARSLGPRFFLEPWNPYLATSWWLVLLLAVWSVLDDDVVVLPLAVLAGSYCAQSHLGYLGLVGGLGALVVTVVGFRCWTWRRQGDHRRLRRAGRWIAGSAALGVLAWVGPLIDQVRGTGNLTRIVDAARSPEGPVAGAGTGSSAILHAMDPRWLVARSDATRIIDASSLNLYSVALVVAWAAAAALVWPVAPRRLRLLHGVAAVAFVLALVSGAEVTGELWQYVVLWATPLSLLVVVLMIWSVALVVRERLAAEHGPAATKAALGALGLLGVLAASLATAAGTDATPAHDRLSRELGTVTVETVQALSRPDRPGGGRDGRYLVRWEDPIVIGAQGIGLLNELERAGFSVGVDAPFGAGATRHRVLDPDDATAVVQVATGSAIATWERRPDAVRVARADIRTDAERTEFDRLVGSVIARLRQRGQTEVANEVGTNLFTASIRQDIGDDVRTDMERALTIGAPVAVFVLPASAA